MLIGENPENINATLSKSAAGKHKDQTGNCLAYMPLTRCTGFLSA